MVQIHSPRPILLGPMSYSSRKAEAWLVVDQEVNGSNPFAPTIFNSRSLNHLRCNFYCAGLLKFRYIRDN